MLEFSCLEDQPVCHKQSIFKFGLVGPVIRTTGWPPFKVLLRRSVTWFGHRRFGPGPTVFNCNLSEKLVVAIF